jgi:hypothetical protein
VKNLRIVSALLAVLALARLAPAASREKCSVAPLTASDLAAGPDAINAALACLQGRIQALEGGAPAQPAAQSKPAIAEALTFDNLRITMDRASLVDKKQVLLELTVTNNGKTPVLAMVDDYTSSVSLRGEASPRRFDVQGFASCGSRGWNARDATRACVDKSSDNHWTLLEPGAPYELRLSTKPGREIKADAVSARIRFLTKTGGEWKTKDLSFAALPLVQ